MTKSVLSDLNFWFCSFIIMFFLFSMFQSKRVTVLTFQCLLVAESSWNVQQDATRKAVINEVTKSKILLKTSVFGVEEGTGERSSLDSSAMSSSFALFTKPGGWSKVRLILPTTTVSMAEWLGMIPVKKVHSKIWRKLQPFKAFNRWISYGWPDFFHMYPYELCFAAQSWHGTQRR